MLSGTLGSGSKRVEITEGRMLGDQFTFRAGGNTYTGKVKGRRMEGTAGGKPWSAAKG